MEKADKEEKRRSTRRKVNVEHTSESSGEIQAKRKKEPQSNKKQQSAQLPNSGPTTNNSLAGLAEDLLLMIIRRLGLMDRSNLSSACKRLYEIEAKENRENWKSSFSFKSTWVTDESNNMNYNILKENGIALPHIRPKFPGARGAWNFEYYFMRVKPDSVAGMDAVVQRIAKTSKRGTTLCRYDVTQMRLEMTVDFSNPLLQRALCRWVSALAADRYFITHTGSRPALLTPEFINALPWGSDVGHTFKLQNLSLAEKDVSLLCEKAREQCSTKVNLYGLPLKYAPTFGRLLLGINNFTWRKAKDKKNMKFTHSFKDAKVFSTSRDPIWFFMQDERNSEYRHSLQRDETLNKIDVAIGNGSSSLQYREIPFVSQE